MDTKDQAAIVTGGASGLGAATARALAAAGAKVAVIDVNEKAAAEVADSIKGIAIACDVADSASGEAAVKKAAAAHGPARILVNCAGVGPAKRIVGREGPMPLADYERVIRINLIGTFNMMRLVAGALQTAEPLAGGERGVIVSTASVAAFEGQIGQAAYSSSKGGVAALTLPAAREFAQFGIRVLAIAPGIFGTPMLRALPQETQEFARRLRCRFPNAWVSRANSPRSSSIAFTMPISTARSFVSTAPCAWHPAIEAAVTTFSNTRTVRIEWGDCDPAGIIFYPRYFEIFDASTAMLFERALGMTKLRDVQEARVRRLPARAHTGAVSQADAVRR